MQVIIRGEYLSRTQQMNEKTKKVISRHHVHVVTKVKNGEIAETTEIIDFSDQSLPKGTIVEVPCTVNLKTYNNVTTMECVTFSELKVYAPAGNGQGKDKKLI